LELGAVESDPIPTPARRLCGIKEIGVHGHAFLGKRVRAYHFLKLRRKKTKPVRAFVGTILGHRQKCSKIALKKMF
jgi:hypothetical protein